MKTQPIPYARRPFGFISLRLPLVGSLVFVAVCFSFVFTPIQQSYAASPLANLPAPNFDPSTVPTVSVTDKFYIGGNLGNTTYGNSGNAFVGYQTASGTSAQWATAWSPSTTTVNAFVKQLAYGANRSVLALLSDGSLWRTKDAQNWTRLYNPNDYVNPSLNNPPPQILRIATAEGGNRVYALVQATNSSSGQNGKLPGMSGYVPNNGLYISTNGGDTFTQTYSFGAPTSNASCCYQRNAFDMAGSPADSSVVWVRGGFNDDAILYSIDGGSSFADSGLTIGSQSILYADPVFRNRLYIMHDSKTEMQDGFTNAPTTFSATHGQDQTWPGNAGFANLVIDAHDPNIAWIADGRGIYKTTTGGGNGGQDWVDVNAPVDYPFSIVQDKDGTLWAGGNNYYATSTKIIASSGDGGTTWVGQTGNMNTDAAYSDTTKSIVHIKSILPPAPPDELGCNCAAQSTNFVTVSDGNAQLQGTVNTSTGNLSAIAPDLTVTPPAEAADLPLNLNRFYNSLDSKPSPLGQGWRHSFQWDVYEAPATGATTITRPVTITTPEGRRDTFLPVVSTQPSGTSLNYTSPRLNDDVLVKKPDGSFTLTTPHNTVQAFSINSSTGVGRLENVRNAYGNGLDLTYNSGNGTLAQVGLCLACGGGVVAASHVQALYFDYNANGQLQAVSDRPSGDATRRSVSYGYNSTTYRLASVTDTRNQITTLVYDTAHNNQLQTVTDANIHNLLSVVYDAKNRVSTASRGAGTLPDYSASFDYSIAGMTKTTDVRGKKTYHFYDLLGRTTTIGAEVDAAHAYAGTRAYDKLDHLTQISDPNGNSTTVSYTDTNGQQTPGLPTQSSRTVTSYTAQNQTQTDTITQKASYTGPNRQISSYTDALNHTTTYSYDSASGLLQTVQDAVGNTTTYARSDSTHPRRVTQVVYSNVNRSAAQKTAQDVTVDYVYDTNGFVAKTTRTFQSLTPTALGTTATPAPGTVYVSVNTAYNASGQMTDESDAYYDAANVPAGTPSRHYVYDSAGHVVETDVRSWGTPTNLYQSLSNYDAAGNLQSTTTYTGQKTSYTYDSYNRLLTSTQVFTNTANNLTTTYAYYAGDSTHPATRTVTDPAGVATISSYDTLGRLIETKTTLKAKDGSNTPYTVRTTNVYDGNGLLRSTTRSNSGGTGFAGDQIIQYNYDALGRQILTLYADGNSSRSVYDKTGNVLYTKRTKTPVTVIDGSNNWTLADSAWNDPAQVITTTNTYDTLNRLMTSARSAYDPTNTGAGDPQLTTTYSTSDVAGTQSVTDAFGRVTTSQSNGAGQTLWTTRTPATASGVQPGAVAATSYSFFDPNGRSIRTIDPANTWSDTHYDVLGRADTTTNYTGTYGNGTALTASIHFSDSAPMTTTTVGPAPLYAHAVTVADEAGRMISSTSYTGAGSSNWATTPTGALTTQYGYDTQGNRTSVTDANNHSTTFAYENTGWLTGVSQTITGVGCPSNLCTTSYTYDRLGNRLTTSDAKGHSSSSAYDVMGRNTSEKDALNNAYSYGYDGVGRRIAQTDAKSQKTVYGYDNATRLTRAQSFDNAAATQNANTVTTNYALNAAGLPLTMTDVYGSTASPTSTATTTYAYDGLARRVSTTSPQGVVQYGYDSADRRTSLKFGPDTANLKQVSYGYDGLSRPTSITSWASATALSYGYDTLSGGKLSQTATYPNGVSATWKFDGASRLTDITHTSGATTLFGAAYSLDNAGNRTAITETINGTTNNLSYGYNEANALTLEQGNGVNRTYTYDAAGNRSTMQSGDIKTSYSDDNADRLTGSSTATNAASFPATATPVITAVNVSAVNTTSVSVTWTTNIIATSQVEYGTTAAYGTLSPLDTTLTTNHSVTLSGLPIGTTYSFRVRSQPTASANNTAISDGAGFRTGTNTTLGSTTIQPTVKTISSGTTAAFKFTAAATGIASTITLYTDATSPATSIVVGLYAQGSGKPGALLAQGTITSPVVGQWNTTTLNTSVTITAGMDYWIAVLTPQGAGASVKVRTSVSGTGLYSSQGTGATALPTSWTSAASNGISNISAYASGGSAGGVLLTSSTTYTPDANGDVTGSTTTGYSAQTTATTYDVRRRTTQQTTTPSGSSAQTTSFSYDGANTRTGLTSGGQTTSYLQDTAGGLPVALQERVGTNTPGSYLYGLGSTSPLMQTTAGSVTAWYYSDALGSVRVLSNTTGSVLNTSSYSAYGTPTFTSGSTPNTHGYAGEQIDPTGLSYNRARYYDATLGRFTQRDTFAGRVQNPLSLNRHIYAKNSPTNATDPSGYASTPQDIYLGWFAEAMISMEYWAQMYMVNIPVYIGQAIFNGSGKAPDIANGGTAEIFEIKPSNANGRSQGQQSLREDIAAQSAGGVRPQFTPMIGNTYIEGTLYTSRTWDTPFGLLIAALKPNISGLIGWTIIGPPKEPVPVLATGRKEAATSKAREVLLQRGISAPPQGALPQGEAEGWNPIPGLATGVGAVCAIFGEVIKDIYQLYPNPYPTFAY